jgi:hypothetical protein
LRPSTTYTKSILSFWLAIDSQITSCYRGYLTDSIELTVGGFSDTRAAARLAEPAQSFKIVWGSDDGSNPAARTIRRMEVATSNADQPKPVGPDLQSPALAGREAWSLHLDRVQTLCGDFPQPGFFEIMGRMSQRGDTSSTLDERDCEAAVEPGFIHASGTSIAEETKENLARAADLSSACQIIGQVAPTQAGAGEDATDVAEIDRQPETAQPCDHGLNPLGSAGAERCHAVEKGPVVIANEMPEDVKLTSTVLARELNTSDKLDTPPRGLGARHREC